MNLIMIWPRNERKDSLLSITKNCETLNKQTQTKPEETLEIKLTKPRKTFHFSPPISVEECWMLGITSLGVFNSISNITEENSNFQVYRFRDSKIGGIAFEKVRD